MMSLTAVQISELTAQFFLAAAGTLSFAILLRAPGAACPTAHWWALWAGWGTNC